MVEKCGCGRSLITEQDKASRICEDCRKKLAIERTKQQLEFLQDEKSNILHFMSELALEMNKAIAKAKPEERDKIREGYEPKLEGYKENLSSLERKIEKYVDFLAKLATVPTPQPVSQPAPQPQSTPITYFDGAPIYTKKEFLSALKKARGEQQQKIVQETTRENIEILRDLEALIKEVEGTPRARFEARKAKEEFEGLLEHYRRTLPHLTQQRDIQREMEEEEAPHDVTRKLWEQRKKREDWQHEVMMHDLGRIEERAKQPTEETKKKIDIARARGLGRFEIQKAGLGYAEELTKAPYELAKKRMGIRRERESRPHKLEMLELERERDIAKEPWDEERLEQETEKIPWQRKETEKTHEKEVRKLKEEYGGVRETFGATLGQKWVDTKKAARQAPGKFIVSGMEKIYGAAATKIKTPFSNIFKGIEFSIITAIWFWITTSWFIPMIEGYAGYAIMPGWFVSTIGKTFWFIIVAGIAVTLPISIILGYLGGVDFKPLNTVMITMLAAECAVLAANNWVFPTWKAWYPDQYAFMMCMVKYSGNMQICALNQTQQVQVQKTGSYQTLDLQIGVTTPSRSIPPTHPNPSLDKPYYLPLTLTNKNEVGSPYDIQVLDITVKASHSDGKISKLMDSLLYFPENPIKPGGYVVVQAKWNSQSQFPSCNEQNPYTYFRINVSTNQSGGGSTKYGIIENDNGIDNQNFMYFFDPDVKTQPGPLDIYTYTIPFVLPINQLQKESPQNTFQIYITIDNKGNGVAEITSLDLVFNSEIIELYKPADECYIIGSSTIIPRLTDVQGNHFTITGRILNGESCTIVCRGNLKSTGLVGKTTSLISIVALYDYQQTYNEQMSCVQTPTTTGTTVPTTTIYASCNDACSAVGSSACLVAGGSTKTQGCYCPSSPPSGCSGPLGVGVLYGCLEACSFMGVDVMEACYCSSPYTTTTSTSTTTTSSVVTTISYASCNDACIDRGFSGACSGGLPPGCYCMFSPPSGCSMVCSDGSCYGSNWGCSDVSECLIYPSPPTYLPRHCFCMK